MTALLVAASVPMLACTVSRSAEPDPPVSGGPMPVSPLLNEAHAVIGLGREPLLARFDAPPDSLKRGKYGPSDWMEVMTAPPPIAGWIFLAEGKVALVVLDEGFASGGTSIIEAMRPDALQAAHPAAERLNSRAGKHFNHWVDAAAGLAWTEGEGKVPYVEVFAPTDLDTYKKRFYKDPGAFTK